MRDFVNAAAKELGMAIEWRGEGIEEKGYLVDPSIIAGNEVMQPSLSPKEKCIVSVDADYFRPTEVETLLGDPSKAKEKLGWEPKIIFDELVAEMVREDMKFAERDELVKEHGFNVMSYNE